MLSRFKNAVPPVLALLALLLAWQSATQILRLSDWLLPSPLAVGESCWINRRLLLMHGGTTLFEASMGFLCGVAASVPLAALLVSFRFAGRALYPLLAGFQSIPKAALAPLILVWVGPSLGERIAVAFLGSFFPILVGSISGMTQVPREIMELMQVLSPSRLQVVWMLRLPNALPYILSASRTAVTLAVVGAIVAEFIGGDSGLGYLILAASSQLKTDLVFGALALLGVIGAALFAIISLVEKLALPGHLVSENDRARLWLRSAE